MRYLILSVLLLLGVPSYSSTITYTVAYPQECQIVNSNVRVDKISVFAICSGQPILFSSESMFIFRLARDDYKFIFKPANVCKLIMTKQVMSSDYFDRYRKE